MLNFSDKVVDKPIKIPENIQKKNEYLVERINQNI